MGIRILLIFIWVLACVPPAAAQDNDVYEFLARINALRQQNGLPPLDVSNTLTTAAQRHSDDMARTGIQFIDKVFDDFFATMGHVVIFLRARLIWILQQQ